MFYDRHRTLAFRVVQVPQQARYIPSLVRPWPLAAQQATANAVGSAAVVLGNALTKLLDVAPTALVARG